MTMYFLCTLAYGYIDKMILKINKQYKKKDNKAKKIRLVKVGTDITSPYFIDVYEQCAIFFQRIY